MINLLPPEVRENYRFARRNRRLLPWIAALIVALIILIAIGFYGNLTLNQTADNYKSQIALNKQALKQSHVDQVKAKVGSISSSLQLTVKVLSREILFSKLLTQISTVVPDGVNLTGLNINQDDGAIDLTAHATNYQAATQLQVNLTDPANQIFSKADLISVNCGKTTNDQDTTHPCTVSIRAEFASNNQFLFIGNQAGAKS